MYGINTRNTYDRLSKKTPEELMEIEKEGEQKKCSHDKNAKLNGMYNKHKRSSDFLVKNLSKKEINDASVNIKNNDF